MFELKNKKDQARRGVLSTAHGFVQTPVFMPIATKGAVKTLSSADLKTMGSEILLSNTFHLMLRPGLEQMQKLGGLHRFMNWDRSILTDSGGYQVFSLPNKTTEEGVEFQSPIDGAKIFLTPELSMQMQQAIGSDIWMQFDDVAAGDSDRDRYEEAMERSLRWAKRCKEEFDKLGAGKEHKLFGIVQGGTHEDLRERSAKSLMDMNFDGYAIGGLSVGEKREDAFRIAKFVAELLPKDKPRYFMGGGFPEEIVYYVSIGVDMFDCVLPTRNARHGTLFVWKGDPTECVKNALAVAQDGGSDEMIAAQLYEQMHITNEKFALDPEWAYLRHLFMVGEPLAMRMATEHNLDFYLRLMTELRQILG